jgi:3-phenylpropionate/trans-cinnamate dioxygenase ferredoxin subunit
MTMEHAGGNAEGVVPLASVAGTQPGTALARTVGGYTIALFNVDGALHALDDACLRCCASLAAATLDGARVVCACGFGYDLATGAVRGVERLRTGRYDVTVVGDDVCVAIPALVRP